MTRTISPAIHGETVDDRLDAQVDALWTELQPIIAGERSVFAQRCHELGLSMSHLHLMSLLDTRGAMTMGTIAETLGAALPNVTGLVSRMQQRGVVERLRDEGDRRVVLVRLTRAGMAQLRKLELIRRRRLTVALSDMTQEQREALLQSIHHLRLAVQRVDATKETVR